MAQLVDTIWANGLWADTVWADGVWASGAVQAGTTSEPSGGGRGAKRYGRTVKFNGQFYDSVRDRLRLSRDVDAYNKAQNVEPPKVQTKAAPKPKTKARPVPEFRGEIEQPPSVDWQRVVGQLQMQMAQSAAQAAQVKRLMAEIDDDDSEILLLS